MKRWRWFFIPRWEIFVWELHHPVVLILNIALFALLVRYVWRVQK